MYSSGKVMVRRLLPYVLVLGVLITGLLIFQVSRFHLVSTTPSLKSVSIITPSISFNYSSRLSETGVKVSSRDGVVKSFAVSNKALVVSIDTARLTVGKTYELIVGPLQDTRNRKLAEKTYSFKVVSVDFGQLSKSQQADILKQQANVPYTRSSINYAGFDALTGSGLSLTQLEGTKQAFFLYSNFVNQKASLVAVVDGSVVQAPYDSSSSSQTSSVSFSVKVDGSSFNARLVYSGLSDVELFLYNQNNGGLVYDSGVIAPTSY